MAIGGRGEARLIGVVRVGRRYSQIFHIFPHFFVTVLRNTITLDLLSLRCYVTV